MVNKNNQQLLSTMLHCTLTTSSYHSVLCWGSLAAHGVRRLFPRRHPDPMVSSFRDFQLAMKCAIPPIRPEVFETPSPVLAPTSQSPVHAVPGPLRLTLVLLDSLLPPLRWLTNPAWDLAHHSSSDFAMRVELVMMFVCLPVAYP